MRRRPPTPALLLLLLGAGLVQAACGGGAASPPSADTAAEAARVRAAIDQFYGAAQRRDWDAAGEMMSAEFELYTDEAAGFDKPTYVRLLKEDDLVVEHMELKDVEVQVSPDGRMAWSKFRGRFRHTSHGTPSEVETVETLIFRNEGGRWKIAHAHASVKPVGAAAAGLTHAESGPARN